MNDKAREKIKSAVLKTFQSYGQDLKLPVPIKRITKHLPHVRLVPYSQHMKEMKLSYSEMLAFAETKDACTHYNADLGRYIIYYNDCDQTLMQTNRYRWNIAHELGHVVLGHLENHAEASLRNNTLTERMYHELEEEADRFASYILVPHIVLACFGVVDDQDIADLCRISKTAAKFRSANIQKWKKQDICTDYDFAILSMFSFYVEESDRLSKNAEKWLDEHRACSYCHAHVGKDTFVCPGCSDFVEVSYIKRKEIVYYPDVIKI